MSAYISAEDLGGLGYDLSQQEDQANIDKICLLVSSLCDAVAGQPLGKTEVKEKRAALISRGNIVLFTSNTPIISVSALVIRVDAKTSAEVDIGDLFIDEGAGRVEFPIPDGILVNNSFGEITYNCGYEVLPQAVKSAAVMLADSYLSAYFTAKKTSAGGVTSIKDGERAINMQANKEIPAAVVQMLSPYKRVR